MNRWSALALLLAIAGALALRSVHLEARPMHPDEAVGAFKVRHLWEQGRYTYDPHEFHGPTLAYATLPFLWLGPARDFEHLSETTLRLVPVAFGTGLILLLLLFADGLGRHAVAWSAVFTAVSPAMVFYSRYFIHEMLLVFFTTFTLGAAWRYWQERRARWAAVAGAGLGLMWATKETFVLAAMAMTLAAVATYLWGKWRARGSKLPPVSCAGRATGLEGGHSGRWGSNEDTVAQFDPSSQSGNTAGTMPADRSAGNQSAGLWNPKHAALAVLAAALVWLLLFSSFFTDPKGLPNSFRAYLEWTHRASGASAHIHPWWFYLERLAFFHPSRGPVSTEGLFLLLALAGASTALFRHRTALGRFLVFYTLILMIAYGAIPYKTPWCLLGFLQGLILLAGIGATTLVHTVHRRGSKVVVILFLAAATLQLAWQAWRASGVSCADPANPYVYAQTVPDLLNLVRRVEAVAKTHPSGQEMVVKVMAPGGDYWPLPWYLRRFKHSGWWDRIPPDPYAPVIIASSKLDAALDQESNGTWLMAGLYELRPGNFMELYVEAGLWRKSIASLSPDPE